MLLLVCKSATDMPTFQALRLARNTLNAFVTKTKALANRRMRDDARNPPASRVLESGYAHIEVDLSRQVLFAVDVSGSVSKILPVSTGTGKLFTSEGKTRRAVTPSGRFTISHKISGWRRSPLGLLYYPNYIVGGIAIHGNPSVPVFPASHGCIRIPMFAAKEFSKINPIGTVVIVYYSEAVE
jgi:lipoprotein-anchoring transpeptidase ErfK/SrfK